MDSSSEADLFDLQQVSNMDEDFNMEASDPEDSGGHSTTATEVLPDQQEDPLQGTSSDLRAAKGPGKSIV